MPKSAAIRPPWPRLSELAPAAHPEVCIACGVPGPDLDRWQEHDERDLPEDRVAVLCRPCGKRLVKPHPRLYRPLGRHEPWPGCMPLCVECRHRDGTKCTHPTLTSNGGPGLEMRIPQPHQVHVQYADGHGRRGAWQTVHPGPVEICFGWEKTP